MSKKSDDKLNEEQPVDLGRRGIAKAGLVAPVIMTLASRPVFGAQCLSNMMSGNMSQDTGGGCVFGWSDGGWKQPGGKIYGYHTLDAWYEALKGAPTNAVDVNAAYGMGSGQCDSYTGGVTFGSAFGIGDSRPMRQILCDNDSDDRVNGAKLTHFVTAYLNSRLIPDYILTTHQVLSFYHDPTMVVPAGFSGDLNAFLDWTWNGGKHGSV